MNAWTAFAVGYVALLLYFFLFPFRSGDYDDLNQARWRRCLLIIGAALAIAFLVSSPLSRFGLAWPHRQVSGTVRVWVNSRSGFYYCPGTYFYGRIEPGEYMREPEAIQSGYQPSLGLTCR